MFPLNLTFPISQACLWHGNISFKELEFGGRRAHGMEAANRLNQTAVREEGKVEARRITRALELPPVCAIGEDPTAASRS